MQGNKKNPYYNQSGYPYPTAYKATKKAIKDETDLDNKVGFLIKILKFIIRESGFELVNRIELKDVQTGRYFK